MDKMARSYGQRLVRFLWHSWSGCLPGTLQATQPSEIYSLIFMSQLFSPASVIFAGVDVLLSVCFLNNFPWAIVTHGSIRRLKTLEQATTLF